MSETLLVATASFENAAPVIASPPKSIELEPAEAVYKALKAAVADLAKSRAVSKMLVNTLPLYTCSCLLPELKYKSPSFTAFPTPSVTGAEEAAPRYRA